MSDTADRRKSPRGLHEEALATKVISSSDPNILPGRTFISKTADISLQGLRIRLNHEPEIGSVMEVWIVSHLHEGTIVLSGTVRWARPVSQDGYSYQAGLEIADQPTPDFLRWQHVVADLLPHAPRPPSA
jgi:hypothetical protein